MDDNAHPNVLYNWVPHYFLLVQALGNTLVEAYMSSLIRSQQEVSHPITSSSTEAFSDKIVSEFNNHPAALVQPRGQSGGLIDVVFTRHEVKG